MKRFVTYLYECERGSKSKNVGFIRVNIRNEKTDMQVILQNCMHANGGAKVFALINKKNLLGIELGEIKIRNGQSDGHIIFATENIMDCGYSVNEIVGVGIRLEGGEYFASCWKDAFAEEIVRGEFLLEDVVQEENREVENLSAESNIEVLEETDIMNEESFLAVAEESRKQQTGIESQQFERVTEPMTYYEKINLNQIRDLPSPNWHLATNSFLVHGFWNYGYLVLKKEVEEDKETLSLGVPGIFEKPEAVMAIFFGFPDFQEVPPEKAEIEKNQEPKIGTFGCWFVNLKN